jgi:hypothetical protein
MKKKYKSNERLKGKIKAIGGVAEFSKKVGESKSSIYMRLNGFRGFSLRSASRWIAASGGHLTFEDLHMEAGGEDGQKTVDHN